jgi:rhamnosyltransferase
MEERSVCAVIVTHHPDVRMLENIPKVLEQVQRLVVVDNGSTDEEIGWLRTAAVKRNFQLIENGRNLGIAEALNQGVLWARSRGVPWALLFDQDSRITNDYVERMFASWDARPDRDRIFSLHPQYIDPESGKAAPARRAKDGGPIVSMTSGALMPTRAFSEIGYFDSTFFIDEVDTEYCYRIRAAGYLVADSKDAYLLHAVGHPVRASFLGLGFVPNHHSALRRYYMTRNRLIVYRRYLFIFPLWVLGSVNEAAKETLKCFLGEDDRIHKLRNLLLGTWDALWSRMGKREGL